MNKIFEDRYGKRFVQFRIESVLSSVIKETLQYVSSETYWIAFLYICVMTKLCTYLFSSCASVRSDGNFLFRRHKLRHENYGKRFKALKILIVFYISQRKRHLDLRIKKKCLNKRNIILYITFLNCRSPF